MTAFFVILKNVGLQIETIRKAMGGNLLRYQKRVLFNKIVNRFQWINTFSMDDDLD